MAIPNKVSAVLEEDILEDIHDKLKKISEQLSFLIRLPEQERISLPFWSEKDIHFIKNLSEFAEKTPSIIPPDLDMDEARKDVILLTQLQKIISRSTALYTNLVDTYKEVGAEAYAASLVLYLNAKIKDIPLPDKNAKLPSIGKHYLSKS
jgi:hypothetical protein